MVKCKDGPYVDYDEHKEIVDYLRKSAEINPAQSPHDGIHTCPKGCKKPGCNRGLRDTIEEQDAQIEALKQDLKEEAARSRHVRMKVIHFINTIGGLQEELAALRSQFANSEQENAKLKADFYQASDERSDYAKDVSKLKAEVERLRKAGDELRDSLPYIVDDRLDDKTMRKIMNRWNAAKEEPSK
jgi:chromosome segregation ATPase